MEIQKTTWRGRPALIATGPIVSGDAVKFSENLPTLPVWSHRAAILLLDSSGGSVSEALKISKLMDSLKVHTVVPKGARCASACASIVFLSGKYRTIEEGGLLGQHSCSLNGVANQECNNILSKHALNHGVSYGSVAAFVTYVAPDDISWMDRAGADCSGLTRYPFEAESGFERSEPCVIQAISGRSPGAQTAWRIDFKENGYRAFQRTAEDHKRELELSLSCNESRPGASLSMDIEGPNQMISDAVVGASLSASPLAYADIPFKLSNTGDGYTQLIVELSQKDVAILLQASNKIVFTARLKKPYTNMVATTYLSNSRKALSFATQNCDRTKKQ